MKEVDRELKVLAYLAGELSAQDAAAFEHALKNDPSLARLVHEYRKILHNEQSYKNKSYRPSANFTSKVKERVHKGAKPGLEYYFDKVSDFLDANRPFVYGSMAALAAAFTIIAFYPNVMGNPFSSTSTNYSEGNYAETGSLVSFGTNKSSASTLLKETTLGFFEFGEGSTFSEKYQTFFKTELPKFPLDSIPEDSGGTVGFKVEAGKTACEPYGVYVRISIGGIGAEEVQRVSARNIEITLIPTPSIFSSFYRIGSDPVAYTIPEQGIIPVAFGKTLEVDQQYTAAIVLNPIYEIAPNEPVGQVRMRYISGVGDVQNVLIFPLEVKALLPDAILYPILAAGELACSERLTIAAQTLPDEELAGLRANMSKTKELYRQGQDDEALWLSESFGKLLPQFPVQPFPTANSQEG